MYIPVNQNKINVKNVKLEFKARPQHSILKCKE